MSDPSSLRKHAKYSASSAHRWMKCYGSVRLSEAAPPQDSSIYAEDGTEAHDLFTFCLENGYRDAVEGSVFTDNTHDKDRTDAVQIALDYVYNLLDAYEDAELIIERKVQFPSNVDPDETYGYVDVGILIRTLNLLYVIDYKHGVGVAVEVKENEQCLYYGTAIADEMPDVHDINLVVIQPRGFHADGMIREYLVPRERLERFVVEVDDAIIATMQPDAPLTPGEKPCRWCAAKLTCPAIQRVALMGVVTTFQSVQQVEKTALPDVKLLTPSQLSYILKAKDLLVSWANSAEKYAAAKMKSGEQIPDWKLVEAQPRRKWWGLEENVAVKLAELAEVPIEKVYPPTLISLTDATALVQKAYKAKAKRGKAKEAAEEANKALALLTVKDTSGNLKVVEASDPRPAHDASIAAFQTVKTIEGTTV